jgi:hypothetical protein
MEQGIQTCLYIYFHLLDLNICFLYGTTTFLFLWKNTKMNIACSFNITYPQKIFMLLEKKHWYSKFKGIVQQMLWTSYHKQIICYVCIFVFFLLYPFHLSSYVYITFSPFDTHHLFVYKNQEMILRSIKLLFRY